MPVSIKGFVREGPRVGGSNSPFTITPDLIVSDPSAYATAYPSNESTPRTEYLVLVLNDGRLGEATFGWVKNEALAALGPAIPRFDYNGQKQSFLPLQGNAPDIVGVVASDSNSTRLKVSVPIGVTSTAPFRLSVGFTGSGTTLATTLVTSFGSPAVGTVEILTLGGNAGQLNWNPADLVTYLDLPVKFQRQAYYTTKETKGRLGTLANNALMLSPIPGTTQIPLIRIGYGLWLIADEKVNEAAFSGNPTAGHVEWARDTGLLKFNATDLVTYAGRTVYYDGSLLAKDLQVPRQSLGTINTVGNTSPQGTTISSLPTVAGYEIVFRIPGVIQFSESVLVTTLDPVGKKGQVQYKSDGTVQISQADRQTYSGQALQVVIGDLPIERGLSLRLFRTPVDLTASDPTIKDVSSIYPVTDATWADPMIQSPQVFLPSLPIDDQSHTLTINVNQGTGSFNGVLPRLDVASPPAGYGYTIDFDKGILQYAKRNIDALIPILQSTYICQLPDPLIVDSNFQVGQETAVGSGVYSTLTRNVDYLLEPLTGQVSLTDTSGTLKKTGTIGNLSGSTFTDTTANFISSGINPGDFLIVPFGAAKGVYLISGVSTTQLALDVAGITATRFPYEIRSGKEILADRYFKEVSVVDPNTRIERIVSLGTISNSPRLTVPNLTTLSRIRIGTTTYATLVTVANDGLFTSPGSLPAGTVEVSSSTGNLNFSTLDSGTAYWARKLTQGSDYQVQAALGLIQFTDRMLISEEGVITYTSVSDPATVIEEPITFIVRKETVQSHPAPTSTVSFNPLGHRVASNPAPQVWRGGRPQPVGQKVTLDTSASTVTFLADTQLTDALPHGATVSSNESIMVTYFIYDALGGEKTTNVLNGPINLARVVITAGATTFTVVGDYTAQFPANYLLRVGPNYVYMIASSSYDGSKTTITLANNQIFAEDAVDPKLYVSSGAVRFTGSIALPSYFAAEVASYDTVARGMNNFKLVGDRTSSYKTGIVLYFSNGTFYDMYLVSGTTYNAETNRTTITLTSNTLQQYSTTPLKYSVRPVFEASATEMASRLNPALTFPGDDIATSPRYRIFRRVEGQVGQLLSSPLDYKIDTTGALKLVTGLQPNEEVSMFYTGYRFIQVGLRIKTSYTNIIAPDSSNGLLNQILKATYSVFSPDSFFYRVETLTNFRGEVIQEITDQAKGNMPSAGPQTSNTAQSKLITSGRDSVYAPEHHYANQDIIARVILKYYNDAVNYLEDALQGFDGRIVGDRHGRFKFDGSITNALRTTVASVTNQIDDQLKVSPFPSPGTYQATYLRGPYSRFFCSRRNMFAGPTLAGTAEGDQIAKFAFKNLNSVPGEARRRTPRAQIMKDYPAGTVTFEVDNAAGTSDALLRPGFVANTRVVIRDAAGATYINEAANVTVSSTALGPPPTITLSGGSSSPIPAGATIYLSSTDASTVLSDSAQTGYAMVYKFGKDVNANLETGELLWAKRIPPFDGSLPTAFIPKILYINEVATGDILQANGVGVIPMNTDPYKFPALTGGAVDDDGDQAVPMLRSMDAELIGADYGALKRSAPIVATSTGTIRTATTVPFLGTGSLDVTKLIITNSTNYSGTLPQTDDVVRILSGLNGATSYKRITAVTANTITVDSAFALQDTGFSYTIALSSLTATGTASLSGTALTDGSASFLSTATIGQTVTLTGSADAGRRRQIVAIASNTALTLNAAFPTAVTAAYRLDNPLGTFGGPGSVQASLSTAVTGLANGAALEQSGITGFFNTVFTQITSSTTGVVTIGSLSIITDASANFVTAGINTSHFIYVASGTEMGVYQVASVDSATQITVTTPFPGAATNINYQIVSCFSSTLKSLQDLMAILKASITFQAAAAAFQSVVNTVVPVTIGGSTDSSAFGRGIQTTDIDTFNTAVVARITALTTGTTPVSTIEGILQNSDRYYDARYAWIDGRINIETGILFKQSRAIEFRIKALTDVAKQLTKLLAV